VENRSKNGFIMPVVNVLLTESCKAVIRALFTLLIVIVLCSCMPDSASEREDPALSPAAPDLIEQPAPQPIPEPAPQPEPNVPSDNFIGPSPVTNVGANVEWIHNNDVTIDPSTSIYVDSTQGLDSGAGSKDDPVQTIAEGLSRLAPGMTLLLRGGEYNEQNISISVSGTDSSPITIRNYPGERVVVNASVPQLRSQQANNWELVNAELGLYRSRRNDYGEGVYTGTVIDDDSQSTTLVPYYDKLAAGARGLEDLNSTEQQVVPGARYVGPGIYNSAGTLFVRLEPISSETLQTAATNTISQQDAETVSFEVSNAKHVFSVSGSWINIQGLELRGARIGFDVKSTAQHIDFSHNTFHIPGTSIVIRENAQSIDIDRCHFDGNFPQHIAWTDMKGGDGQSMPASYWTMKAAGISATSVTGLSVTGSLFDRVFDGLVITASHEVVIDRNSGFFIDDMVQIGSDSSNVFVERFISAVISSIQGLRCYGARKTPPDYCEEFTQAGNHNALSKAILLAN